jgi:hypothetical protein
MAATVVGAIDKDAAHAHIIAHLAEGDLLGPHAAIKATAQVARKLSIHGGRDGGDLLQIVGVEECRAKPPEFKRNDRGIWAVML